MSLVLHILPADARRGAQQHARALCGELKTDQVAHHILTIFSSKRGGEGAVLDADFELAVPDSRLRRGGCEPRAVVCLHQALKKIRPDLVVAHGGESLKYAVFARAHDVPLIYHKIGTLPRRARTRRLHRALQRGLVRRASVVVCVSDDVLREAQDVLLVPATRGIVIANGRDERVFFPADDRVGRARPLLVFVGQLVDTKRPEAFIELVEHLHKRGTECRAAIVGDGPLRSKLTVAADRAGVEMLGARDDVPSILRECEIFVFTSEATGEGMPGVLIEAGLTGLPTVATDVPGARSVVEDGVTGFVVASLQDLAGAVQKLISNPELRARMGARARAKCLREFSIGTGVARWRDLIDRSLRQSAG